MILSEASVTDRIRLKARHYFTKLFRNNVGLFKTTDGRVIRTGLCKGSSDLIGFKSVTVTQEMVGKKVAIFVAVEVKKSCFNFTPSILKTETIQDQTRFINAVKDAGGIAGFCRSEEEFKHLLE